MEEEKIETFAESLHSARVSGNPAKFVHGALFYYACIGKTHEDYVLASKIAKAEEIGTDHVNAAKYILDVTNTFDSTKIKDWVNSGIKHGSTIVNSKQVSEPFAIFLGTVSVTPPKVYSEVFSRFGIPF